jgi:hypothetical protein
MSLTQLVVYGLAVFLVWAGLIYPLLSPWVDGITRLILFALIVTLMAWFVVTYHHPKLYAVLAVAGLVAVLQRWRDDLYAPPVTATVVRDRNPRVPPNGV